MGQSHKFLVRQSLRGVELTARGLDCCRSVTLGERRGGQHAQKTSVDARVTLEAEGCCRPGPELGEVPIEKPRPIEIGDEPTRGRRALDDGVRRGCSQVVRASAGNRGPFRRLRSPDPAIQPSRKSDVVLEVTAARPITHR